MTPDDVLWTWAGPPRVDVLRLPETSKAAPRHIAVMAQGGVAGVVVLAERAGELAMVQQSRPAVGRHLWELPRGFGEACDVGDTVEERALTTAARELREETGLRLTSARVLGAIYPDSGLLRSTVFVVHGTATGQATTERSEGEVDALTWHADGELDRLIVRGVIADAITLGALALWRAQRPPLGGGSPLDSSGPR